MNDTTNNSIFHMSGGIQGVYSKMLRVVRILFYSIIPLDTVRRGMAARPCARVRGSSIPPCFHNTWRTPYTCTAPGHSRVYI